MSPKRIVAYKNQRYTDGVKPATINRELATLKKAFNLARREWEWCTDNPVCRVSMERENNTRDRWLTGEEEMRLFPMAAPWLRDLMLFAIHTGMRMGEILGLTWAGGRSVPANGDGLQVEERRTTDHSAQSDGPRTAEAQIWKSFSGNGIGVSERSTDAVECE